MARETNNLIESNRLSELRNKSDWSNPNDQNDQVGCNHKFQVIAVAAQHIKASKVFSTGLYTQEKYILP